MVQTSLPCDIFLSHSGAQKGFVKELYAALSASSYSVFFDQDPHSLLPAQPFPPRIFSAAESCRLAIVVLSEEFVTSPWPMMELCAFVYPDTIFSLQSSHEVSATPSAHVPFTTILPLFYNLSVEEIKRRENVQKWWRTWKEWEEKGRRISAQKCEEILTKVLPSLNGVVRRPESVQGPMLFIDEVICKTLFICPPRSRSRLAYPFDDPQKSYVGMRRRCQILLDKFRKLEGNPDATSSAGNEKICILGMHGLPGSGKSTLCRFMCNSMFDELEGNVLILQLPTEFHHNDSHSSRRQIEAFTPGKRSFINDLRELYDLQLLPRSKFIQRRKMFLVLDNICTSNYESYSKMVQNILIWPSPMLGSGSRVMLVAPSVGILEDLRNVIIMSLDPSPYRHEITNVPQLTESEAVSIITHAAQEHSKVEGSWSRGELMTRLFSRSDFLSSSMCIPLVLSVRKKMCIPLVLSVRKKKKVHTFGSECKEK